MKKHFRKAGWIYLPVTIIGWIVTIAYIAIAAYTLFAIERSYHSLYRSLIRFFPYFISFSVVWYWIASNTSDPDKKN